MVACAVIPALSHLGRADRPSPAREGRASEPAQREVTATLGHSRLRGRWGRADKLTEVPQRNGGCKEMHDATAGTQTVLTTGRGLADTWAGPRRPDQFSHHEIGRVLLVSDAWLDASTRKETADGRDGGCDRWSRISSSASMPRWVCVASRCRMRGM
ncbi:hypothetical protein LX32DRAFT_228655 [Colletotrichum zoysiae]|uniref:Uncharacterized protein n=1 Tax=Colletotrichum zoysiae TaxID=1216348 RepID=A0AAD9LVC4_9PEZI|nr:hypothetical protein LX32DRAFT_228655 [Colletotrichum zoysiae]